MNNAARVNRNRVIKVFSLNDLMSQDVDLSLFQKTMLVTDGTLTDLLRLYSKKKIIVKKINQNIELSGEAESKLCEPEMPILKREILLGSDEENYVYADSIFLFENLSIANQYKLLETDIPIGLLWKKEKLDTFRDIIEIQIEYREDLTQYFEMDSSTPFLSRTYKIYNNKKTLGIITEKFPITYFKGML